MEKNPIYAESLEAHRRHRGKLEVTCPLPIETMHDLAVAYTPGVAEPCREIERRPEAAYEVTSKAHMVAVITDGSAVLGLGDIGAAASLPVMEGKCALFKRFAGIDAFPICIDSRDTEEIVRTAALITASFGGVNLEAISAPRCFEVERLLQEKCDIPVFHDDQHGTAVIVLAGLLNALKIVGKKLSDVKIVASGAGAAGTAIIRFVMSAGARNVIMCDKSGAIYEGRTEHMNAAKEAVARDTNPNREKGSLADVLRGADVFLGVSAPGLLTADMVKTMNRGAIVFAMANPTPEVDPVVASKHAAVVATGRSDFPNQINNVLAFPGIFRGAFDVRAREINDAMKIAASRALAGLISDEELSADYIIPAAFDPRVGKAVAEAVAQAARDSGVARI